MDPQGTLVLNRIRRILRVRVFNLGLLDCGLCGERVATMGEVIMREQTDGVPLCQSCFQLLLKEAAQTLKYRKLA